MQESYVVACFVCRGTFDAMDAPWCSCLTTDRSLVCTRCLTCFCKALPAYKSHFWASAPKALWAQKFEENNSQPVVRENPSPETVIRPLVLVVEDEPAIQRVAARVVESLGYGLVTAKNGEEGLELAKRYKPDVVLSDALMPRMDGREMCRQLKENPETAGIKVVVMTSLYKSVKYRTEAQGRYRVDDYLVKPLDFNEVRGVLQKHVDSAVAPRLVSA